MGSQTNRPDHLRQILDVARSMAATTDLDALLRTIVSAACRVLHCARATIFLYEARTHELISRVATGNDEIRFPAERGIAGAVVRDRCILNVPDAYADERFNPEIDRQTGFRTTQILAFPLENAEGELMGVLQALNKTAGPFDESDEELALVLAAQAGVALHRWRLLEAYAEQRRMARDLEIARSIQQSLFPRSSPAVAGYEIAGWNRSADETGGDCYDFIPLPDGRWALLLADATGHGIGAALIIAQCRALVRAMLSVTQDLPTVMDRVNVLLEADLQGDRFVTAALGILDPRVHRFEYIAAGQGPVMFVSGNFVESRPAGGIPLGVADAFRYGCEHFAFRAGDALVLLTDGFYEAGSSDRDLFGQERVLALLRKHGGRPLSEMIDVLHQGVCTFTGRQRQEDDLTALLVRRNDRR